MYEYVYEYTIKYRQHNLSRRPAGRPPLQFVIQYAIDDVISSHQTSVFCEKDFITVDDNFLISVCYIHSE